MINIITLAMTGRWPMSSMRPSFGWPWMKKKALLMRKNIVRTAMLMRVMKPKMRMRPKAASIDPAERVKSLSLKFATPISDMKLSGYLVRNS